MQDQPTQFTPTPPSNPQQPQPPQYYQAQPPVQPVAQAAAPQPAAQGRDRAMEYVIPINRDPFALAAGYVALFNIPFILTAPIALALGIVGLVRLRKNPQKAGMGRALFAIIYSGLVVLFIAASFAIRFVGYFN